jgi:hypothetical protein
VQLLKEKEVWQEGGINLAGLQVRSASLKEANEALLHRFGFLDNFQPVIDATPVTMDDEIMELPNLGGQGDDGVADAAHLRSQHSRARQGEAQVQRPGLVGE